jgi:hypothetical protein
VIAHRPSPAFRFARAAAVSGLLCALAGAARAQTPPAGASPADPCAAAGGAAADIADVTAYGELRLADGRLGRFADLDLGLDAVTAGRWPDHVAGVRRLLAGQSVRADEGAGVPDRWGRRALRLSPAGEGPSFHRQLVAAGLARVAPLGEQDDCARALLPVEAEARRQGLGLWREPAARLLGAAETAALTAMAGRFAVVEGRVLSVGTRPRRVYLNFGRDFRRDFSASLSLRAAVLLEKAGIAPSSLRGKTVRLRGMVAMRQAPAMEIAGAGQIEVVE